jgi:hypothetical protein
VSFWKGTGLHQPTVPTSQMCPSSSALLIAAAASTPAALHAGARRACAPAGGRAHDAQRRDSEECECSGEDAVRPARLRRGILTRGRVGDGSESGWGSDRVTKARRSGVARDARQSLARGRGSRTSASRSSRAAPVCLAGGRATWHAPREGACSRLRRARRRPGRRPAAPSASCPHRKSSPPPLPASLLTDIVSMPRTSTHAA